MSGEDTKHFINEDDDARHRREEVERRAKRKVCLHIKIILFGRCFRYYR